MSVTTSKTGKKFPFNRRSRSRGSSSRRGRSWGKINVSINHNLGKSPEMSSQRSSVQWRYGFATLCTSALSPPLLFFSFRLPCVLRKLFLLFLISFQLPSRYKTYARTHTHTDSSRHNPSKQNKTQAVASVCGCVRVSEGCLSRATQFMRFVAFRLRQDEALPRPPPPSGHTFASAPHLIEFNLFFCA